MNVFNVAEETVAVYLYWILASSFRDDKWQCNIALSFLILYRARDVARYCVTNVVVVVVVDTADWC